MSLEGGEFNRPDAPNPQLEYEELRIKMLRDLFESGQECNVLFGSGGAISHATLAGYDAAYCKWDRRNKGPMYIARHLCNIIEVHSDPYILLWETTPTELRRMADYLEEAVDSGRDPIVEAPLSDGSKLHIIGTRS